MTDAELTKHITNIDPFQSDAYGIKIPTTREEYTSIDKKHTAAVRVGDYKAAHHLSSLMYYSEVK